MYTKLVIIFDKFAVAICPKCIKMSFYLGILVLVLEKFQKYILGPIPDRAHDKKLKILGQNS